MIRDVLLVTNVVRESLDKLLSRYGLTLVVEKDGDAITGCFWGESEAGIVESKIYVRRDTPIHSLLHEACHVICMTSERRDGLDRDAGGDDLEESAVCYLQIVLAEKIAGVGGDRLMLDMDVWGYSFRLGSTRDWFLTDAEDAKEFLVNHGLLNASGTTTFRLRE